tara:strand:- start:48 stop:218 length:171 start_codon:yes stop_codon:yes gene_type:complete
MSHSKNKTHGGKGVITPSVEAVSNFRHNFDKIDWSTLKVCEPEAGILNNPTPKKDE